MEFPPLRSVEHNPRLIHDKGAWWLIDELCGYRARIDLPTLARLNQEAAVALFVHYLAEGELPDGPKEIPFGED